MASLFHEFGSISREKAAPSKGGYLMVFFFFSIHNVIVDSLYSLGCELIHHTSIQPKLLAFKLASSVHY